jgi:hypothetical protein
MWLNPADFVAPPPHTYGNAGRGILMGPATPPSMSRRASGSRSARLVNPNAGRIGSTIVANRSMQFALNVNFWPAATFARTTGGQPSRFGVCWRPPTRCLAARSV